jgi:glucose/mannose-6-phosphate isomerase
LSRPLLKLNNYGIFDYFSNKTLFLASSYSGTTEEVIYNTKAASKRQAMVAAITVGGQLLELCQNSGLPLVRVNPVNNPSEQPRMGQGYMIFGPIALLNKLGIIKENVDISFLSKIKTEMETIRQKAKQLINQIDKREVIIVAADHLAGNAHILRNQINETAKLFAGYNLVPELNHHLMEGLKHPQQKNKVFVFINSDLYYSRNSQRLLLTKEVIEKNGYETLMFEPINTNKLAQMVEVLIWGGFLSYYLGKFYGEDPNKIPWVNYFKEKLGSAK